MHSMAALYCPVRKCDVRGSQLFLATWMVFSSSEGSTNAVMSNSVGLNRFILHRVTSKCMGHTTEVFMSMCMVSEKSA